MFKHLSSPLHLLARPARLPIKQALLLPLAMCSAIGAMAVPAPALAQTAVMVEAGNQSLRDDIQWLIDRGIIDLTTSTWPMPLSALESALASRRVANLSRGDQHAMAAVEAYVAQQRRSFVGVTAGLNTDRVPQLGFDATTRARAGVGAYGQASTDGFAGKVQVNGLADTITNRQSNVNLEGSYAAAAALGQVLYVGQLAHFWGPGQDGSLNWGNAATAIPGIGLQRGAQTAFESQWLSWIGPWGYDLFVGQMQHNTAVPQAKVLNMRAFARPVRGLEIGLSRFIQFGGKGRPNGLGAVWDAVTGDSNIDDPNQIGTDPSNELSGIDARYTFSLAGNPLTIYTQLTGEDEAGGLPSRYLGQIGAQFKHMVGTTRMQWYAEAADTTARRLFGLQDGLRGYAYNHGSYTNGLYHDQLPIGHSIGGDGQLLSGGVTIVPDDYRYFSRYSAKVLHAQVNRSSLPINQAFDRSDKFYGGEFAYSWMLKPATFKAGVTVLRSVHGNANDAFSLMLSMNVPLGGGSTMPAR
mgnify:CR=1 FL=1